MMEIISRGVDAALGARHAQVDQVERAFQDVGVRVFLETDQEVGALYHRVRQVAVRIEFGADHGVRADDLPRAAQQVAFAVVVAVGDHRAMQAEERDIHLARAAQVVQQLIAQRLVGVAGGDAGRRRACGQAFDQRPVLARGALARGPQRTRKHLHAVRMLAGGEVAARPVGSQAGRNGGEGVRLGRQGPGKDLHE